MQFGTITVTYLSSVYLAPGYEGDETLPDTPGILKTQFAHERAFWLLRCKVACRQFVTNNVNMEFSEALHLHVCSTYIIGILENEIIQTK